MACSGGGMFERSSVVVSLAIAGVAVSLAPARASACEPLPAELKSSVPADGAELPANSAVLLFGQSLSVSGIEATVDGQPAGLTEAEAVAGAGLAVKIDPEPLPGQTVALSGDFCQDAGGCGVSTLSFVVTAPDVTAPSPDARELFFAVYDHLDFLSSGADCQYDSDVTYYVHVLDAPPDGAVTVFTASWDPDGDGPTPAAFSGSALGTGGESVIPISVTAATLQGADPLTGVCLTVTVGDLAGNPPRTETVCPACYHRADDVVWDSSTPPEPAWSTDDVLPDSVCAPVEGGGSSGGESETGAVTDGASSTGGGASTGEDTSATGGEDGGEKGCACDSRGGGSAGWLALLLVGLGLRRRR